MKILKFLSLLGLLTISSCSKDNNDTKLELNGEDNLVFGSYAGECPPLDCGDIFKLNSNSLYKDVTTQFISGNWMENPANLIVLSNDKFLLANDLLNYFPISILNEERRIGNPGELDGAIYYVQLTKNGETKIWEIDDRSEKIPAKFRIFLQELKDKMTQLQ